MSWSKGRLLPMGAAVLVAVLFGVPALSAEETLVIRLPLNLDGDVSAHMTQGAVSVRAQDQVPKLELLFSAAEARIFVTNFTDREVHNMPRGFGLEDLVNDPQGGSEQLTPQTIQNVRFDIGDLTDGFGMFLFDGAQLGATYDAHAVETPARLDLSHDETILSYTDDPKLRDFKRVIDPNVLMFGAPGMRYEVRGDFNFVLHGATMTAHSDSLALIKTGTWSQTYTAGADPVNQPLTTTTTTQYLRAELTDAVLTMVATGADQQMFAHAGNLVVDVDGRMQSGRAAGSITYNNETVRAYGENFGASGQFRLVPTYVIEDADNKEVVVGIDGPIDSLSVGRNTYLRDEPLLTVAVSAGGIIGLLGLAYAWKGGLFLPLYAKLTKAKVLDQATRQQIHHKVESDPGCQVKQVAEALDISWTTASYHLRVLRKMGLVVAKRQGRHEHFFAAGSRAAQNHALVAALQNKTAKQIVEIVLLHPGIIQKDLCERLGIAASTASGHLAKLRDIGALSEEREWKKRRYFAGPALQGLPVHIVGNHVAATPDGVVSAT